MQGIAGYLADIYGGENILAGAALLWSLLTLLTPFLFDLANKTPFAITIVVFVRVALGICQGTSIISRFIRDTVCCIFEKLINLIFFLRLSFSYNC